MATKFERRTDVWVGYLAHSAVCLLATLHKAYEEAGEVGDYYGSQVQDLLSDIAKRGYFSLADFDDINYYINIDCSAHLGPARFTAITKEGEVIANYVSAVDIDTAIAKHDATMNATKKMAQLQKQLDQLQDDYLAKVAALKASFLDKQ